MSTFLYQSISNETGGHTKGRIKSVSHAQARKELEEKGMTILSLRAVPDWVEQIMHGSIGRRKAKPKDCAQFYRSLATALAVGEPFTYAVDSMLRGMSKSHKMRPALERMKQNFNLGMPPHEAISAEGAVVGNEIGEVYKASTASRKEPETPLITLADITEQTAEIAGKVRGALYLPIMYIVMTLLTVVVLMLVMIPMMEDTYAQFDGSLPGPTRLAIGVYEFFTGNVLRLLAIIVAAFTTVIFLSKSDKVRLNVSKMMLHVPIFGKLQTQVSSQRLCSLLGVMLSSQVPHLISIGVAQRAMKSVAVKQMLANAEEDMRSMQFPEVIEKHLSSLDYALPSLASQTVAGEEDPGANWTRYGNFLHRDTARMAANLSQSLEQAAFLFAGLLVGITAVVFYLPMFDVFTVIAESEGL